jgi:hypothetical protein
MKRRLATAACTVLMPALLVPAVASAKIVTIGSPMTQSLAPTAFDTYRTATNTGLPEPGALIASPANGTVVSWKVTGASGGPFRLRIVRPFGAGTYTGAGTSAAGAITGGGVLTFPTSLRIQKGDLVGVDPSSDGDQIGAQPLLPGSEVIFFASSLANDGPGVSPVFRGPEEVGLSAQVLLNCVVPKVKGKKIKAARRALVAAGCDARPTIKRKRKGKRVRKQNPAAGKEIPSDRSVVLKV